jgi:fatty-acyl-CoA synthase
VVTGPLASGLAYWPARTDTPLQPMSIGERLAEVAAAVPDRLAVTLWEPDPRAPDGGHLRSLNYHDLEDAARRVATGLLTEARPGDRIGLWAPNTLEWVIIEYAAALAGLVLVPLNPALTLVEAADLIERSGCVLLLAQPRFRDREPLRMAHRLAPRLGSVRRVVALPEVLTEIGRAPADLPVVSASAPFLIQYTSGTTGKPKGAVLTQITALNVGWLSGPPLELPDGAVYLSPLPLHHVGASVCGVLTALGVRGTIVLGQSFDAATMLLLAERCRATLVGGVPTTVIAMLDHPDFARRDLSGVQIIQIGGSTVPPALIRTAETAFHAHIANAYGQSEAPAAVQTWLDDSDEVKARTIGRAGLHREARIARPVSGDTAGFGEVGELCIRSAVLTMTEYLDDPEQSGATIDADGWLHTGDLCSMDADGVITIHGRLREVVIRGGENIYPAELENVLLGHPGVAEVSVVGVPDAHWGEQVAAFVRWRPGAEADWDDLEAYARQRLARFKVPRFWRAVTEYPLTASGKVQKFVLRQNFRPDP